MEQKFPTTIIAMQGVLLTGKTSVANYLATHLRCSTIRLGDILDAIFPGKQPPTPEISDVLMSQAFEIIPQIAKTQVSLGLSIIVDSPLSRRSHLDKLVGLLIVECKPRIKYAWQMRLEEIGSSCANKWCESHKLPMEPEFGRDYTDNDIHPSVSKLVINTTDHVPLDLVAKAVHHLATDSAGQKIDFDKWRLNYYHSSNQHKQKIINLGANSSARRLFSSGLCRNKHTITEYKEEGIDYDATCAICQKQLSKSDSVYTCRDCSLAIHKSCAELDGQGNKTVYTPEKFPGFFLREPIASYCFPEQHLRIRCQEARNQFSYDCRSWSREKDRTYVGLAGALAYCCKECTVYYHPECALMPALMLEHKHGGYVHDLELRLHREKELEDYICDVCFQKMNPEAWYYYCKNCNLSMHLDCAFKDFDAWPIDEP